MRPRPHPFGRPPSGFGAVARHSFPSYHRKSNNPMLSGPPPHPFNGRPGLTVRRPMPTGPSDMSNMPPLAAQLGQAPPSRASNGSPPGIQPRSLSGAVALDDADETNPTDLKTPQVTSLEAASQEIIAIKPPKKTNQTRKVLVCG